MTFDENYGISGNISNLSKYSAKVGGNSWPSLNNYSKLEDLIMTIISGNGINHPLARFAGMDNRYFPHCTFYTV